MRVLLTGSAGRIGSLIHKKLSDYFDVIGLDIRPSSTTQVLGDIRNTKQLDKLVKDVDIIVHTAALHAPHVDIRSDDDFTSINVDATQRLAQLAITYQVKRFVFTSTTALYGHANQHPMHACWIDETVPPRPKTIYHHTKYKAENILQSLSERTGLPVSVIRMSRCFPEPANLMALYRLYRGVDARDVADAHLQAIKTNLPEYEVFIVSGVTPFQYDDNFSLKRDPVEVLGHRAPELLLAYQQRNWRLPESIDRVYDSSKAQARLSWQPKYGFESVIKDFERGSKEILPSE
ncbi:MAG: NAD-dependent epimerase/dehydratase family protein [Alteromonadaceae bacterium]|nr:NAD-dependent epimerase/dehydratase family protein [Alteromonadaceae bacterium]